MHEHDHDPASRDEPTDWAAMAQLLDLDAEVLHACLTDLVDWVGGRAPDGVRGILDLGAGTGTGSIALARRFEHADVLAVDSSAELLTCLRAKALDLDLDLDLDLGLADRIRTVRADLDDTLPALEDVEVVWASLFMHHLADPDRALAGMCAAMRSGAVLAVVEMNSPPRFLPDDIGLGRPGLETRCHAALADEHAASMPELGTDWGPRLVAAGFTLLDARSVTADLAPGNPASPDPAITGRYAQAYLQRIRAGLEGRLAADDLAALDTLLADGPESLLRRTDLTVRASRDAWIARRP